MPPRILDQLLRGASYRGGMRFFSQSSTNNFPQLPAKKVSALDKLNRARVFHQNMMKASKPENTNPALRKGPYGPDEEVIARLKCAIREGNSEEVKQLLKGSKQPASLNHPMSPMESLLAQAVRLGELEIVKTLLQNGADPNLVQCIKAPAPTKEALNIALKAMGLDYSNKFPGHTFSTPLVGIVRSYHYNLNSRPKLKAIAEMLLKYGAHPYAPFKGKYPTITPLESSVLCGANRLTKLFLEKARVPVDLSRPTRSGKLLIAHPVMQHYGKTLATLVKHGADINCTNLFGDSANKMSPLMFAVANGDEALAKTLLELGADPVKALDDDSWKTPLAFTSATSLDGSGADLFETLDDASMAPLPSGDRAKMLGLLYSYLKSHPAQTPKPTKESEIIEKTGPGLA